MMVAEKAPNAARLDGRGFVKKDSAVGLAFLMFNEAPGRITADQAVRTAIAQVVNPVDYATATQGTLGTASTGDLFPSVTACGAADGQNATDGAKLRPKTDPAAAAATLEQAGWTKSGGTWTKDGKPLSVRIHSHGDVGQSGDYVAQVLKDFGIDVEVKMTTVDRYVEDAGRSEWDVYAASLAASASPSVIGAVFGGGGLDWGEIRNEAFSSEVRAARAAATPEETCTHWQQAQNALFERVDVVPEAFINSAFFGDGVTFDVWTSGLIEPTSLKRVG
jgi:peptide/nickel transport system substrate-binding protein